MSASPDDLARTAAGLEAWLIDHGGRRLPPGALVAELGLRLLQAGAAIMRVSVSLDDFHPEFVGRSYSWHRDSGREEVDRRYTPRRSEAYQESPVRVIAEGAAAVRRRLEGPDAVLDFGVTRELQAQGATDYLGIELPFTDGSRQFLSFASDRAGGFRRDDLVLIDRLKPAIAARIEIEHGQRRTEQLLQTYLGTDAARRVSGGLIRRNMGEDIEAIVMASDVRGFTRLADTLPARAVIEALGEFYEAVADPVRAAGGDIVKMVGDGILAIFPLGPRQPDTDRVLALRARDAVLAAEARLRGLEPQALPAGVGALRAGFALHLGPVTFGNVGARDRLDFTVIGPAVNEVFRLEALTKVLGFRCWSRTALPP